MQETEGTTDMRESERTSDPCNLFQQKNVCKIDDGYTEILCNIYEMQC